MEGAEVTTRRKLSQIFEAEKKAAKKAPEDKPEPARKPFLAKVKEIGKGLDQAIQMAKGAYDVELLNSLVALEPTNEAEERAFEPLLTKLDQLSGEAEGLHALCVKTKKKLTGFE